MLLYPVKVIKEGLNGAWTELVSNFHNNNYVFALIDFSKSFAVRKAQI